MDVNGGYKPINITGGTTLYNVVVSQRSTSFGQLRCLKTGQKSPKGLFRERKMMRNHQWYPRVCPCAFAGANFRLMRVWRQILCTCIQHYYSTWVVGLTPTA